MSRYLIASEENLAYLAHHGIQGQKWGIRRFQNEDGSLTPEGRERYGLNKPVRGWKAENSAYRMDKRSKDIIKTIKKEAKMNKEKLTDEELLKRIKKEYNKIYKDKKLADIMYTMDIGHRKWAKTHSGPIGVTGGLIIDSVAKSKYNKKGYESPEQSMHRAIYEYHNYYNKDKKIPERYKLNKKNYKRAF